MSELATNLRSYAVKYANDYGYCVASDLNKAADRIEALEFEVEHERYNVEKTAQEAAKRIKALEAALREILAIEDQSWGEDWCEINEARGIARAALDQSSPPKAST